METRILAFCCLEDSFSMSVFFSPPSIRWLLNTIRTFENSFRNVVNSILLGLSFPFFRFIESLKTPDSSTMSWFQNG